MRGWGRVAIAAALVSLAAPAVAAGDQFTIVAKDDFFDPTGYMAGAGDTAIVRNDGETLHDVEAEVEKFGQPLFGSELVSAGDTAPVNGTEYLKEDKYDFVCSIHDGMDGQLDVEGQGAVPRPKIDVAIVSGKLNRVRKGRLKVAVKAATDSDGVRLTAALAGKGRLASSKRLNLDAGERERVTLKLNKRARKKLKGAKKAKIQLRGTVPYGAPDSAKKTLR